MIYIDILARISITILVFFALLFLPLALKIRKKIKERINDPELIFKIENKKKIFLQGSDQEKKHIFDYLQEKNSNWLTFDSGVTDSYNKEILPKMLDDAFDDFKKMSFDKLCKIIGKKKVFGNKKIQDIEVIFTSGTEEQKRKLFDDLFNNDFEFYNYVFDTKSTTEEYEFEKFLFKKFLEMPAEKVNDLIRNTYINEEYENVTKRYRGLLIFISFFLLIDVYYLFICFYQLAQRIVVSDAAYASVMTILAPIVFLIIMSFAAIFYSYNFILKFIKKDIMKVKIFNTTTRDDKKLLALFLIATIGLIIFTPFFVANNIKIKEDGFYCNQFFTFEYKYYAWSEIDHIKTNMGDVNRPSYAGNIYTLVMKDSKEFDLNVGNYYEVLGRDDQMINFVSNKTGLALS